MLNHSTSDWRSERRHHILTAAKELFSQANYDSVQMDGIARAAGIGKPTLCWWRRPRRLRRWRGRSARLFRCSAVKWAR